MRNSLKSKTKTIQKQKRGESKKKSNQNPQKKRVQKKKSDVLAKQDSLGYSKGTGVNTDDSTTHEAIIEEVSKNSSNDVKPKSLRPVSDFNSFLEVPIERPTLEEFSDPFKLIASFYQKGYDKQGVVKIIPPPEWKPEFQFSKIDHKVNTRVQVVNNLSKGKVEVEYAADLPSQKYGSAFSNQATNKDKISYQHSFNLKNINRCHNSLFQFIKNGGDISGITTPWVYLGMMFATFCFHVEDLYMYALNYLHMGAPKTWYTVPADYKEKFEEVYQDAYKDIFNKNPAVMHHLNLQLNPALALKKGIPVYRTDQKPGEFIITFPKVYHGGFSHGFNCGEAVNIVTPQWIQFYKEAKFDYARKGFQKKVSFSLSWVLVQIIQSLEDSSFDKPTLQFILNEWKQTEKEEIEKRVDLEKTYGNKLKIYEFSNKHSKYDRNVCKICSGYCYLSYIYCNKCFTQGCPTHITPCSCIDSTISLYLRFNDKEMQQFSQMLVDSINELD